MQRRSWSSGLIRLRPDSPRYWAILALNLFAGAASATVLVVLLLRPVGPPAVGDRVVLGDEGLREEAARVGLLEGQQAPGFEPTEAAPLELTDLDGRSMTLNRFAGRPVWLVFWATDCHACREEEPDLRRAFARHRDDGLVLLAVDAGEQADVVRRYVEARGLPWDIALDPRLSAFDAYGAIGTPTHYFITPDGRIASRAFGRLELDQMEAHLSAILNRVP